MARIGRVKSTSSYRDLQTARILVIVFTTIFLCTGLMFIVTGTYVKVALNHWTSLLEGMRNAEITPFMLIFLGLFIVFSSAIGFASAIKDNLCVINCYCLLLLMIFLMEVIGGILAVVYVDDVKASLSSGLKLEMENYEPGSQLDDRHISLSCCGVNSFEDWGGANSTWYRNQTESCTGAVKLDEARLVPLSCCNKVNVTEGGVTTALCDICSETGPEDIHVDGCLVKIFGKSGEALQYLVITAFSVAFLQVVGILSTLCLFRRLRTTLRGY